METEKTQSKSWLQRLKEESLEAELLVSIASIFAIFKVFGFLDSLVDYFINQFMPHQYAYAYMICFLGYIAFGILGSFFVIHFGLRAYWIGLVGLNSVFPDYSIEDSAYSKIYTEKMSQKLPKLPETINNLDEVCSVIFSAAFPLLIMYTYIGILSSIYLFVFNKLKDFVPTFVLLIPIFLIVIIYLVMTIITIVANIKKFKENAKIQTWYFHVGMWGAMIFYGPFYKYMMQTMMIFGSNFKKKKALVKTVMFMLAFGFLLGIYQIFNSNVMYLLTSDLKSDSSRAYSNYYSINNDDKKFLLSPEIQSDIIVNSTVKLFVPLFEHETNLIEKNCELLNQEFDNFDDDSRQEKQIANLNCYAPRIKASLNGKEIAIDFLKTDHQKTNQFGLRGFIPTEKLPVGLHRLKITKEISSEIQKSWEIPFYISPDS